METCFVQKYDERGHYLRYRHVPTFQDELRKLVILRYNHLNPCEQTCVISHY